MVKTSFYYLMRLIFFGIILILFTTVFLSCKDKISEVEIELEPQPGRRDYEWTIDTLDPFNPVYKLWGSSPSDVWAITTGTWYRDIYHFNGMKWTSGETKIPDPYGLYSIYGFSQTQIFIGAQNHIYKYNGTTWNTFAVIKKDGHNLDLVIDNLWGTSENNMYACGAYPDSEGYANNAVIAHYENNKWTLLDTRELFGIAEHLYVNKNDGKVYVQVIGGRNYTDSTHIYEYLDGKFIKLYSNIWTTGKQADISRINGEVYFCLGNKIQKRSNDKFQTFLNIDNPNFYQRIWGKNSKDIFLMMIDGLAHYNGTDIQYLFNYPHRTQIFGAALFDKEVFFLIYQSEGNLKLIYHGTLNTGNIQ